MTEKMNVVYEQHVDIKIDLDTFDDSSNTLVVNSIYRESVALSKKQC